MITPPNRNELIPKYELSKLLNQLDYGRDLRDSIALAQRELRHVDKGARQSILRNIGGFALFKGMAIRVDFNGSPSRTLTRASMLEVPAGYYALESTGAVQLPDEMIIVANLTPQETGDIIRYGVPFDQLRQASLAEARAVEAQSIREFRQK